MRPQTSFIFDLDGTLTDSVYQNVAAWKEALDSENIPLAMWRIHRKIGMSGGLILKTLSRETGLDISAGQAQRLSEKDALAYKAWPRLCKNAGRAWLISSRPEICVGTRFSFWF